MSNIIYNYNFLDETGTNILSIYSEHNGLPEILILFPEY